MPPRKIVGRIHALQRETKVPDPFVLTEDITIQPLTKAQLDALRKATTDEDIDRARLGESYDAVMEVFANEPFQLWNTFSRKFNEHMFGPGVDDVEGKSEPSSE
jgi:hypothetical protein